MFELLNSRLIANKKTIINTNLSIQELAERYSDRVISRIMGDGVSLINPGVCVAQEARETLAAGDMLSSQEQRDAYRFYLSDDPSDFERLGSVFLERPIHGLVSQVNIEEYSI